MISRTPASHGLVHHERWETKREGWHPHISVLVRVVHQHLPICTCCPLLCSDEEDGEDDDGAEPTPGKVLRKTKYFQLSIFTVWFSVLLVASFFAQACA